MHSMDLDYHYSYNNNNNDDDDDNDDGGGDDGGQDEEEIIKELLVELIIDTNAPWGLVESSKFKQLCERLNPDFRVPSRRQLMGRVLDNVYDKCRRDIWRFIKKSRWISISMDGWKNVRQDHVVNFIAVGDNLRTELLGVENVRDDSQTAEYVVQM